MIKLNSEYLFLKNYKPDKPLIIFTGHPRNWKVVADYNKKFIKPKFFSTKPKFFSQKHNLMFKSITYISYLN